MSGSSACPASREKVLELYFLEHRAKLLDIAAFLDRVDRATPEKEQPQDFRLTAYHQALQVLSSGKGDRAKRVLDAFSDPTTEPIPSAADMKGASGAYHPSNYISRETQP